MFHILLSIVSYDVWFYVSHVLLHDRRLYKYHSEHHEKRVPTAMDTYHGHALEGPFQGRGYRGLTLHVKTRRGLLCSSQSPRVPNRNRSFETSCP